MIKNKTTYKVIQVLGLLSACIGSLTICGYLAGNPTLYTWAGNSGMSLAAAVADILQGTALYIIGERLKKE